MKLLFLGYSNIVRRRVLNSVIKKDWIKDIEISTTKDNIECEHKNIVNNIYCSHKDALEKSTADIVYISLINSLHEKWAEKFMKKGCHVIIDKPAFLSYTSAKQIVRLAKQKNILLAEANVYEYHAQVNKTIQLFGENNDEIRFISANFSFPPFELSNFRYSKSFGGGAINDLGPYAVSAGNIFFNSLPRKVVCNINSRVGTVETSFSVLFVYEGGRSMIGNFGFESGYINNIILIGRDLIVRIDRIFTTPPDFRNKLKISDKDGSREIIIEPCDSFSSFFDTIFNSLSEKNYDFFATKLLNTAKIIDKLGNNKRKNNAN